MASFYLGLCHHWLELKSQGGEKAGDEKRHMFKMELAAW